jgi:hypothetical protein
MQIDNLRGGDAGASPGLPYSRPPHPGAATEPRRREQTADVVRDSLAALDDLVNEATDLQRELAERMWNLSEPGLDHADAVAARVSILTARACIGVANRLRLARRLRADPNFAEGPADA